MSSITTAKERADFASIAMLVAEEAATLVTAGYRTRPHAEQKARHDLVTEYDRASEELVIARLTSLAPGLPIVAEEQAAGGPRAQARKGLVFYVDPIDGTTNFVHGHPFWCVAVGLMEDDVPIVGAVIAPALGLRWLGWVAPPSPSPSPSQPPSSEPGEGYAAQSMAMRNRTRCAVSATASLGDAMIGTGFPAARDRAPANNFDSFMAVKRAAQAVRRCGSAAIDLCLVADGTYDGYWERSLHSWDAVAATAVLLAAGGKITALDGTAADYHAGHLCASNGVVHDELLRAVRAGETAIGR